MRMLAAVPAAVAAALLIGAPVVSAAPCGDPDPKAEPPSTAPVKAVLTLDDKSSATIIPFGRQKDHQTMSLIFRTDGACDLPATPAKPQLTVLPKPGSKQIPDGVLTAKDVQTDGNEYDVTIDVNADKFDPGSYDGLLSVRAPYLSANRTPI